MLRLAAAVPIGILLWQVLGSWDRIDDTDAHFLSVIAASFLAGDGVLKAYESSWLLLVGIDCRMVTTASQLQFRERVAAALSAAGAEGGVPEDA
jgi:hypothetical protein